VELESQQSQVPGGIFPILLERASRAPISFGDCGSRVAGLHHPKYNFNDEVARGRVFLVCKFLY